MWQVLKTQPDHEVNRVVGGAGRLVPDLVWIRFIQRVSVIGEGVC